VTAYLGQTSFVYNKEYVKNVVVKHSDFAELLIKFFEAKFFPNPEECVNIISVTKSLSNYLKSSN
jgi:NAD-specific glutamate dehydrogenase